MPPISEDLLARQLETAHQRLENLFLRAGTEPEQQFLLREALQELSTALEELRVTAETLRAQNDELVAARLLVETQRRNYQELFELAPDAYFVTDPHGVIQQANRKAAALFGVRHDFLVGKPIILFIPREKRVECRLLLARIDVAPFWEFEIELQGREGAPFPAAVTISVIRQDLASGGRPIGLRWIVRDVSTRRHAEAQIESQLQRLTVLGAMNEAVTSTLDLDRIIAVLFDNLEKFFEFPVVLTVRLFHPETGALEPLYCRNLESVEWKAAGMRAPGPRAAEAIHSRKPLVINDLEHDARALRGDFYKRHGLAASVTVPLILKDEAVGILSVYSTAPRDFDAEQVEFLAAVATQAAIAIENSRLYEQVRKQSAELQAAHGSLEEKVAERTAELERTNAVLRAEIAERERVEARLRDSEAKLRELTQEQEQQLIASDRLVSVGELAASIAHEFNNPLQIIMGFAQEMLDEEKQSGPRLDGLKIIEAETVRCRELIRNLMNFARPQSAKPEATEVEPIVAGAARLAWHYLLKSKVRLDSQIAPGLPPIRADANQIQQVMINLLFNAAEAMPEGGEIKIRGAVAADGTIVVSISDSGVGIPESALPHIFRPFFTTKQKKGMGLGLSICERIVRGHGGHIAVESRPGKGTTFHLHFPIAEENYERAS